MKRLENIAEDKKKIENFILKLEREIEIIRSSKNVSLNEEQQKSYDNWNNACNTLPEEFRAIPYKNEKDFLIKQKKSLINLSKRKYKILICEEKGHNEKIISTGTGGTYVNCKRCGKAYTRGKSSEEIKKYKETAKFFNNLMIPKSRR